jgi:hypothetical protein
VQLSLRLVARGGGLPDAAAERRAARLDDPTASLAAAGVTEGAWLLANLRSAQPRFDTVRDITLLTDLVESPDEPFICFRACLRQSSRTSFRSSTLSVSWRSRAWARRCCLAWTSCATAPRITSSLQSALSVTRWTRARQRALGVIQPGAIVLTCLCMAGEKAA